MYAFLVLLKEFLGFFSGEVSFLGGDFELGSFFMDPHSWKLCEFLDLDLIAFFVESSFGCVLRFFVQALPSGSPSEDCQFVLDRASRRYAVSLSSAGRGLRATSWGDHGCS